MNEMASAFIIVFNLFCGKTLLQTRLSTGKPHKGAVIHKKAGWVMVYMSVLNLLVNAYTMFIYGMIPSPPIVENGDKFAWLVMVMTLPTGIRAAQKKQWNVHRACMILFSGALFFVPIQRCLWHALPWLYSAEDWGSDPGAYFGTVIDFTWYALYLCYAVPAIYAAAALMEDTKTTTANKNKQKAASFKNSMGTNYSFTQQQPKSTYKRA